MRQMFGVLFLFKCIIAPHPRPELPHRAVTDPFLSFGGHRAFDFNLFLQSFIALIYVNPAFRHNIFVWQLVVSNFHYELDVVSISLFRNVTA